MAEPGTGRESTVGAGALGSAAIVPRRKMFDEDKSSDSEKPEREARGEPGKSSEVRKSKKLKAEGQGSMKTRVSFHLTESLAERVRNTVYHLSGPPRRLNMAKIAEEALAAVCKKYEREQNGGKPFPQREEELVGGRPVG